MRSENYTKLGRFEFLFPLATLLIAIGVVLAVIATKQKCVKERCRDVIHPVVHHPTIPQHEDLRPYYDVFSHKMSIHLVTIPERPAYDDPAWTENVCECVVRGVSLWDRWRQR